MNSADQSPPVAPDEWITTAEAARRLGVKPDTLYAYVSRGVLHSERTAAGGRGSRFDPAEIERFAARGGRRGPATPGTPPVASALTLISRGRLFYRGEDALQLAADRTFEEVAEWLWSGRFPNRGVWRPAPVALTAGGAADAIAPLDASPLDRLRLIATAVGLSDGGRHDLRPDAVTVAARNLIGALVDCLPRRRPDLAGPVVIGHTLAPAGLLAARLWVRLSPATPATGLVNLLNRALVLLADHELSASTIAARAAASVQADPYAVVCAGLSVVSGTRHGAAAVAVEALIAEVSDPDQAPAVIEEHLRRTGQPAGFGHPLYPAGDPRATALLEALRGVSPDQRALTRIEAVLEAARERGLPPPNVDFAVAALSHATALLPGAAAAIFAIARTAGWIGHAIEEYTRPAAERSRATYTGRPPVDR